MHFQEILIGNTKDKKLLDIKRIFKLRRLIKNFEEKDILHIFTLKSLIIYLFSSIFLKKSLQ